MCLLSCDSVFPLSKTRAVTNCIMRYQVSAEDRAQSASMRGRAVAGLSHVCFPAAVLPGAACSWPGLKSGKNEWDLAHLQAGSAPRQRRMELGAFIVLGLSAFMKCDGSMGCW